MKISSKKILSVFLIINFLINNIQSVAICDLATLKMELIQDIEDNGMLDCKTKVAPPTSNTETEEQKNKRLNAVWDSTCSFEATQDWKSQLKEYFGIDHLVDAVGDPYEFNSEDQADMCEIVRTILATSKPGINMYKLTSKDIEGIDCPGYPRSGLENNERNRICAATGGSFFDKNGWSIFLKPSSILISEGKRNQNTYFPTFIKAQANGAMSGAKKEAKSYL
ncbi:MAG: hypothetical protein MJ252_25210 [archaeon]|nr:hypothetical protein [archaeon]